MSSVITLYSFDLLSLNTTAISHGEITTAYNVKFGSKLNAPGTMSFDIKLADASAAATSPVTQTTPNKALIIVDIDGTPVESYIPSSRHYDSSTGEWSVECQSSWYYFGRRHQAQDYKNGYAPLAPGNAYWTANPIDPRLIAKAVILDALNVGNSGFANMTVTLNPQTSQQYTVNGATINQPPDPPTFAPVYPLQNRLTIEHLITNLSDAGYKAGYDFAIVPSWSAGAGSAPSFDFQINYPRRGSKTSNEVTNLTLVNGNAFPVYTGITPVIGTYVKPGTGTLPSGTYITGVDIAGKFVSLSAAATGNGTATAEFDPSGSLSPRATNDWLLDGSQISYTWEEDGTEQAAVVVGAASSTNVGPITASDSSPMAAGWPVTEASTAFVNAADAITLRQDIRGEVGRREWPIATATITVPIDYQHCPITSITVGDHTMVHIDPDDRFPNGLDTIMRIIGWDINVPDAGVPTITYALNYPLFGIPTPQPDGLI